MPKILDSLRARVKKKPIKQSKTVPSEDQVVYPIKGAEIEGAVGNQELSRRDFIRLAAVAGGGLTIAALTSSPKTLILKPLAIDQLLQSPTNGICAPSVLVDPIAQSGATMLDPATIPKFENQLTGPPPIHDPTVVTSQGKVIRHDYNVTMSSFMEQILPPSMNLLTPVWGYGGKAKDAVTGASLGVVNSSPGPTFEAVRGIPIKVKWQNNITSPYMFAVDPTIHWADPNKMGMPMPPFLSYPPGYPTAQGTVPTVTHLHGSETQSDYDGGPEEWFTSSGLHGPAYSTYEKTDANAAVYYYPNAQPAATLWYHDHALGLTRLNVSSGLAGFYLLRDTDNTRDFVAPLLPAGKYDMPLVIQGKSFFRDGTFVFPTVGVNPDLHPYWLDGFLGNTIVVNGKVWPNLNVDRGQYRLRLLNASNARFFYFKFVNTQTNETVPFIQIGSDGGYLKAPANLTTVIMAPAERIELLIDFSDLDPGTKIILQNTALTGGPSEVQTVGQIIQFTVTANQGFTPKTLPKLLNPTLAGSSFPNLPLPIKKRNLTLFRVNGAAGPSIFVLNGARWSGKISELPVVGTTEEWTIIDLTDGPHPIHLHLIQFQIVSRQDIDAARYATDWITLQRMSLGNANATPPWPENFIPKELPIEPYLLNTPTPAAPNEQGWKDTFLSNPFQATVIRIRFASQDGTPFRIDPTLGPGYVWHCHILDHEDNEMMRPYKVTSPNSQFSTTAVVATSAVVAAILLLYFFQRKVRKRRSQDTGSVSPSSFGNEGNEATWEDENVTYGDADFTFSK